MNVTVQGSCTKRTKSSHLIDSHREHDVCMRETGHSSDRVRTMEGSMAMNPAIFWDAALWVMRFGVSRWKLGSCGD